jgi:hypothetical protein
MADVERNIYFYKVEMTGPDEWKRADVLRGLQVLTGDDQVLALGDDNYAWALVDRVPRGRETGRVRFFRDRRSNIPGWALHGNVAELPIPADAGIVEPSHIVLASDGLIAAEYNHFAPRIPTTFAWLLRTKLDLDLRIGTYIQGDILEQLDRLTYIQLLEFSLVASAELDEELRNAGSFGDAAATLTRVEGGRRVNLRLSAEKHSDSFTVQARAFVKRVLGLGAKDETKVLRVTGYDPVAGDVEAVDLLKQKLVRRTDIEKATARSKVLDTGSAYSHIETAIAEVRSTDLPHAAIIWS